MPKVSGLAPLSTLQSLLSVSPTAASKHGPRVICYMRCWAVGTSMHMQLPPTRQVSPMQHKPQK